MSHASTNRVARSMTTTTYDSLPRTFCIFSLQPHLAPEHGGLRVLAYLPTTSGWCYRILVMLSTCTTMPRCLSVICMLAAAIPIPDSIRAGVMYRRDTWRYSKPGLSPNRRLHTVYLYLCLFSCLPRYHRRGSTSFPYTVRARQILFPDVDLLAEGGLRQYEQRVLDRCDMLAPALPSGGVVRALDVGLSPANETRYHAPSVPWEATSQRFPPRALIWSPFW